MQCLQLAHCGSEPFKFHCQCMHWQPSASMSVYVWISLVLKWTFHNCLNVSSVSHNQDNHCVVMVILKMHGILLDIWQWYVICVLQVLLDWHIVVYLSWNFQQNVLAEYFIKPCIMTTVLTTDVHVSTHPSFFETKYSLRSRFYKYTPCFSAAVNFISKGCFCQICWGYIYSTTLLFLYSLIYLIV